MADKDEHGDDILYPMLQAWGVDTIVIVGAWTEDCVIATCYEAADRYGLDVVLVTDAFATGSPVHQKAMDTMQAGRPPRWSRRPFFAADGSAELRQPCPSSPVPPSLPRRPAARR